MEIKDPNNKFEELRLKTEEDLKKIYPNKNVKVIYHGNERSLNKQKELLKEGKSTTKLSLHNVGGARDFNIIIDGKVLGNDEKDFKIYQNHLWKNAEKIGLFHLDPKGFGKTDPYHIGLVEEKGDGTAFKRLLENYPEIKDSSYYKETLNTILELKKINPKDTTYDKLIEADLNFKPKEQKIEKENNNDIYGLNNQKNKSFKDLKDFTVKDNSPKDLYGINNQTNTINTPVQQKEIKLPEDPYGLTKQNFTEPVVNNINSTNNIQNNSIDPYGLSRQNFNNSIEKPIINNSLSIKQPVDPYGLNKQNINNNDVEKILPKLEEIPKDKIDYDMFAGLKIVPLEELKNSPNNTIPGNIGNAQIGNTDFGESKYDKTYSPNLFNIQNNNYKYERGEQQNGLAQLGLGALRAVSKAGIEFAKSPAYLYSLGEWGARNLAGEDYSLDKALDNSILNALEGLDESIKESLPVYQSYKSGKGNIWDAISSTAFWASDGADGVGYMLGMLGPGYLLKGVNMAAKVSKLGIGVNTAKNIELGTQTMLNTFVESAAEAKGVADKLKSMGASDEEIAKSAQQTFLGNLAVLIGPNLIMNKALLGTKSTSSILDKFKDATGKYTTTGVKNGLKDYAEKALIGIGSEGFWGEGTQTSIENYELNRAMSLTKDGFIEGVAKEYINTLNTTEGQKSILLGAVLSGLGNALGGYRENKQINKLTPTITKLIETNFDGFASENDPYERDENGVVKTDENGNPQYNINNVLKSIINLAGEYKDSQIADMAILKDVKDLHDFVNHNALTRQFVPFYELGEDGLQLLNDKIEGLRNSEYFKQEEFLNKDNKNKYDVNTHIADLKIKAKKLQNIYNQSQEVMKKLDDDIFSQFEVPEGKEKEFEDYKNILLNRIFFETSKQLFFKDKINEFNKELSKYTSTIFNENPQEKILTEKLITKINEVQSLIKQSNDLYSTILDPQQHKEAFENHIKKEEELEETIDKSTKEVEKNEKSTNAKEYSIFNEMLEGALNSNNLDSFDAIYDKLKDHADLTSNQKEQLLNKRKELELNNKPVPTVDEINQAAGIENIEPELDEVEQNENEEIDLKDQEEVSKNLKENTIDNTRENEQSYLNDNKVSELYINGKYFNIANNVVMMRLFNHDIIEINSKKVFVFEKDKNGLPDYHNKSNIDIKALNEIKVGDTITFELVELDEENNKDFVNPPNFDGKHIAIKFKNKLIGFVQQPHIVNPDSKFPEISEEKRNELIEFRKALIEKLQTGPVSETIITKSKGNLYSRTDNQNKIVKSTNVMIDFREKDTVNDLLIFVYADKEGKLQLKKGDLTDKQFNILQKEYSKYKTFKFKPGTVFQMVKDTTNGWSIIPVYANLIDNYTANLIVDKLFEFDNSFSPNDISRELDKYIYSSSTNDRANLYITNKNDKITFKINTQEFTLDDIRLNSEEFIKTLKVSRQNIQVNNIHNKTEQEELTNRNALITNATQFILDGEVEGEYFVQPYLEYSQNILNKKEPLNVTTIEANTEVNQKGTDNANNNAENKLEKLKALRAKKGGNQLNEDSVSSTSRDNTIFNEKQFNAWLKANLPQLKLADKEAIANLKANLIDTFGIYKDLTIYLFSGAGNKTAYHEAFHGVFRNLLSYDEKIAVLKEAIIKYGEPSLEELSTLQKANNDYAKYSIKQMRYLWYEEKLADDHSEFAIRYNDKNFIDKLGSTISNFFNKILRLFNLISENTNTIDTLFKNINQGKYKNRKTVNSIKDIEIFNREFSYLVDDLAYSRELKNVFNSPTIEMKTVKSIANRFISLYQDKINSGVKITDEEARKIFGNIYQQYDKASDEILNNDELYTAVELETVINIIENWDKLVKEVIKNISENKIKISNTIFNEPNLILNVNENTNEINDEDDSIEGTEGPEGFNKGLADAVSIEGLSSASTRLKMFLYSIPILKNGEIVKDVFGIEQYHDFNSLYYYLERNLTGVYTLRDQILRLDELSNSRPELKQIIAKLGYEVYLDESISEMNDQRNLREIPVNNVAEDKLELLRNDFKTNFSKQQLGYTLIKFTLDKKTGLTKYEIIDANRTQLSLEIYNAWVDNLSDPAKDTISTFVDGNAITNGTKKGEEYLNKLNKLFETKFNVNSLNEILLKFGLEYSKETLDSIIKDQSKMEDFKNYLDTYVDYLVGQNPDKKEKNARIALRKLVEFETNTALNTYTSSFNDSENKNIYTIQLPSFASRRIALIKADSNTFKSWLNEMKKDPYYKYSNLLQEFNSNSVYRTEQFKMSMLDGLKGKYGDTGKNSKFTSLSPKDFMLSQIALFQNLASNQKSGTSQGKMRDSEIFKHIYITPSDKTLAMIFDMVKYSVILEQDIKGHFFIRRESAIIKKFYSSFLQEVARIKHNLDIKNDILSTKGQGKYKLIDLKQYYHFNKSSFSEISKFMNKDPKDITEDQWEIVEKGFLTGQAYKFMRFKDGDNSLNSLILPEILNKINNSEYNDIEKFLEETKINNYGKEKSLKTLVIDIINDELNTEMSSTVKEMFNEGLIKAGKDKKYENLFLDLPNTNENQVHYDIFKLAAEFSANTLLANIELSDLLNGDPATYKPGDIQKRTYQSQSMVTNNNFKRTTAKALVVKDYETKSETINELIGMMKVELNMSDKEIEALGLKAYDEINVTDAQVHITPEFYKEILIARGTWNDDISNAFDIAEGKKVGNISDSLRMILAGIKPFIYGANFDSKLGIWTHQQIKCAILPIFKVYADLNPLLAEKRALMESEGIDILGYESSFKASIGYRGSVTNNDKHAVEVNLDDFGIQVDNPVHSTDEENNSMRQLKMLLLGSIDANKTYKGVSGRDIINNILTMEAENIDESLEQLSKKLDTKTNINFSQFVKEMITKRNATNNVVDALEIVNGEFKYPLDNGNLSTQIENLLSSMYTNNVIKQAFAGDARVQATSLGFKFRNLKEQQDNLTKEQLLLQQELQWIKPNQNGDGVEYAECCMPAWAKQFFDENGFVKDIESIPVNLREMLVYRIPTEGLHSMLPIRVVKFLPETMGNFILLPYEVTAQMGADFDFDKLFFIRKEFYMSDNGYNEYKFIEGEEKENVDERWLQYIKYTKKDEQVDKSTFKTWSINRQNVKSARNNKIIDNYLILLTAKENIKLLIKPSGFKKMLDIKKLFPIQPKENFFSSRVQRNYKNRNHTGIALKGQSALHVSGHSYATLMPLTSYIDGQNMTDSVYFNGVAQFNFNNLYTLDGSLIADELSSIMAAILDDIKDPILATLGINKNTIDVLATIIRSGHNTETAIKFVSQLGIKELSKKLDKNTSKLKERNQGWETIDNLINEYKTNLLKAIKNVDTSKISDNDIYHELLENFNEPFHNINEKHLDYFISKETGFHNIKQVNKANAKEKVMYYAFQIKVLTSFKNISEIAKPLTDINKFFAINKEVGPNMEDIISKQELYNKIISNDKLKGFDISKIPSLNSTWNVHKHALQYFSKYFPYNSDYYMNLKKYLYEIQSNKTLDEVKVEDRKYINNFLRYFNDNNNGIFKDLHKEYNKLYVSLPKLVEEIKNFNNGGLKINNTTYESIRNNLFFKNLKVTFDKKNPDVKFIKLSGNRFNLQVKNNMIQALDVLYKTESTKELAKDLIKYSFASGGFFTGLNNYSSYISPEILEDLGYMNNRKIQNEIVNNTVLSEESEFEIVRQMIRNNHKPFVKTFDAVMFNLNPDQVLPDQINTTTELIELYKRENDFKTKNASPPMFISVFDKTLSKPMLYEWQVNNENNYIYNKIETLGITGNSIEVSTNSRIDNSFFKSNNFNNEGIEEESENNEPSNQPMIEKQLPQITSEEAAQILEQSQPDLDETDKNNMSNQNPDEPGPIENICE